MIRKLTDAEKRKIKIKRLKSAQERKELMERRKKESAVISRQYDQNHAKYFESVKSRFEPYLDKRDQVINAGIVFTVRGLEKIRTKESQSMLQKRRAYNFDDRGEAFLAWSQLDKVYKTMEGGHVYDPLIKSVWNEKNQKHEEIYECRTGKCKYSHITDKSPTYELSLERLENDFDIIENSTPTDKEREIFSRAVKCFDEMSSKNYGKSTIAKVLKGSKQAKIKRNKLDQLESYGALSDMTQNEVDSIIGRMGRMGFIERGTIDVDFCDGIPKAKKGRMLKEYEKSTGDYDEA